MRKLISILLLVLLPLQFSWAAVATYCGHEERVGATHLGHHKHQHNADTVGSAESVADLDLPAEATGDKSPGSMDVDCGHCHGYGTVILTAPSGLPGVLSTAHLGATIDEAGGAHAPTRPERPQWRPLA